ncbi:lipopolysaccharide biosynthesis protein [Proteiniclasticum sp.]|uniref:lipopolysaccharide biosynthesis protein n=1 Tax=Proteiniclasticum sp. TaxID=2053595 RepID=UPI0028A2404F|nr:lipopolysaccharide biosynthesis protein [Proteiniclasticum sp.]
MDEKYSSNHIMKSLIWKLLERSGTQGIQFIVQIVLARLLLPEEYGIIAIVMVFILLANVFVQSGFNTALIQKKDADEVDFSSVLYLSLIVATVLYIIIYFTAPFVANFYNQSLLVPVLRVLSITLFIGAFNSVQNAFVAKYMLFKKLFASSLGAVITSGLVGIVAAYSGLGVWALVAQQLTNQLSVAIILWFTVKWRPRLLFSFKRVKTLFSYGSKLLASGLLDTLYSNLRTLIIGIIYTPATLGFYNRGQQFPQLIVSNIDGSIQSVMLPALSSQQDNKKRVKEMMRRAIVSSSFLIFPMMVGMAVVAEPLVKIVLTEKWLAAVPFLQIFCFSYALMPIHTANLQAINAMGRSDIFLRMEVIKKIIGLIILGISLPFGVYVIALGQVVSGIISTFINAYPNKQLLDYSYKEQWIDIMPSLVIAVIMGGIVYWFKYFNFATWQILILQVFVGIFIYVGLAKVFKIESFGYLIRTIKEFKKKRSDINV